MTTEDVKKNFATVPIDNEQRERIDVIRAFYQDIAINLNSLLPESRLKSIAMTKLEESCMFAVKAISHKSKSDKWECWNCGREVKVGGNGYIHIADENIFCSENRTLPTLANIAVPKPHDY